MHDMHERQGQGLEHARHDHGLTDVVMITDEAVTVPGRVERGEVLVSPETVFGTTGWTLKAEGLCRGDVCVPVRPGLDLVRGDGASTGTGALVDTGVLAALLGRRRVVAPDAGIVALSLDATLRRGALQGLEAPDFALPDLDGRVHRLSDSVGNKRLVVVFASWCGCRYDLPGWQALADELADTGLQVLLVALDDEAADVRPFTQGINLPVLLDRQHLLGELYAVSNVPTVVWVDEGGRIARPNTTAFSSDLFIEFTGVASGPHLEAVRSWARDGVAPPAAEAADIVSDLGDEEIDARLHLRVGAEARRLGFDETARRHLRIASDLVPMDFSVTRAAMPLLGEDPFGQDFLDLYDRWQAEGSPYHGYPVGGAL